LHRFKESPVSKKKSQQKKKNNKKRMARNKTARKTRASLFPLSFFFGDAKLFKKSADA
jgi:hypothetical protein